MHLGILILHYRRKTDSFKLPFRDEKNFVDKQKTVCFMQKTVVRQGKILIKCERMSALKLIKKNFIVRCQNELKSFFKKIITQFMTNAL